VTHMCVLYAGGGRGCGGGIAHRGRARHPHAARCVSALCVTPRAGCGPLPRDALLAVAGAAAGPAQSALI